MARKLVQRVEDECCASVLTAPLTDDEAAALARGFAALADPVRLRLLSLVAAGVEVEHVCHDGMIHNFHAMGAILPQGRLVLHQIGEQVRRTLGN